MTGLLFGGAVCFVFLWVFALFLVLGGLFLCVALGLGFYGFGFLGRGVCSVACVCMCWGFFPPIHFYFKLPAFKYPVCDSWEN